MPETYAVVLPPAGIIDVRRAAARLDVTELADAGLTGCRIYFPGTTAIVRVEGEGDDLQAAFRRTKSGSLLMKALDDHAWFEKLAWRLRPFAQVGGTGGRPTVTAYAIYGVTPRHSKQLERDIHDILPSLDDAPHMEFHSHDGLYVYFELDAPQALEDILRGRLGAQLQQVLHEHTGFKPGAWRDEVAIEVSAIRAGLLSGSNNEQPLGMPVPKGMWGPSPVEVRAPGS